jgi:hypothetical protein
VAAPAAAGLCSIRLARATKHKGSWLRLLLLLLLPLLAILLLCCINSYFAVCSRWQLLWLSRAGHVAVRLLLLLLLLLV